MGRLFWKFFLAFWLALVVAGAGVGAAVWLYQRAVDAQGRELENGPRAVFLVNMMAAMLRHGGVTALHSLLEDWRDHKGDAAVYVVDQNDQELLDRPVPAETLARVRRLAQEQGDDEWSITRLETVEGRQYLFFVPADNEKLLRHPPPPPPLLPFAIGILASLGFSALLAWHLVKPIRHLRRAFDAVAAGRLETRVGPRMGCRRDEIAELGRDFDHMAGQLQILVCSQRRLLHDVSHELRSPLARLQAAIGLARQQPEKRDASLDRIERESGRLDALVGELLTLSRLEAGTSGAADEEIDLVELLWNIVDDARFEAEASGRRVQFGGAGEALVKARPELLHRAFDNVIRNAVKFTAEGTAIEISVERWIVPDRLIVIVADHGPGVPESDLQAIFEPFFRSGASAATAGFGLGLAIARRAIEAHGGSIHAQNRPNGGLRVAIVLPVGLST